MLPESLIMSAKALGDISPITAIAETITSAFESFFIMAFTSLATGP